MREPHLAWARCLAPGLPADIKHIMMIHGFLSAKSEGGGRFRSARGTGRVTKGETKGCKVMIKRRAMMINECGMVIAGLCMTHE